VIVGAALASIRRVVGQALREHEPEEVEGVKVGATLRPDRVDELCEGLRVLSELELAALVRGGGTALACANLPRRADLILDTRGLSGIESLDAEEGVVNVGAGTSISELAAAAREAGWEAPLDPPGDDATVGGALAAASPGPRFAHPRDVVLGLDVVLATGARTRCGGRVVKNVTGYDLAKLYTGSFGSLGVIASAWLRLRARPEHSVALVAPRSADSPGFEAALSAARLPTARVAGLVRGATAASLLSGPPEAPVAGVQPDGALLVELAGEEPDVEADRRRFVSETGARETGVESIEQLRRLQAGPGPERGLTLRITGLPVRLSLAAEQLRDLPLEWLAYPGRGLLFATVSFDALPVDADERLVDESIRAGQRAARAAGGDLRVESSPTWARAARDVFAGADVALALARSLKEQFDPLGVLNPGRFVGGL